MFKRPLITMLLVAGCGGIDTVGSVDDLPADTAATMLSFILAFLGPVVAVLASADFSGAESPQAASGNTTSSATIHCRKTR